MGKYIHYILFLYFRNFFFFFVGLNCINSFEYKYNNQRLTKWSLKPQKSWSKIPNHEENICRQYVWGEVQVFLLFGNMKFLHNKHCRWCKFLPKWNPQVLAIHFWVFPFRICFPNLLDPFGYHFQHHVLFWWIRVKLKRPFPRRKTSSMQLLGISVWVPSWTIKVKKIQINDIWNICILGPFSGVK